MWSADVAARWRELSEEIIMGMAEWREQHPRATLREIEAALDERLARMLQDTALASAATDLSMHSPWRNDCAVRSAGVPWRRMARRSARCAPREERPVRLHRTYARCPACGGGLFPPG
jgi:hypothetical protein